MPEPSMPPLTGVEALDGLRDLLPRLRTGLVATMRPQRMLERAPDSLHRRMVCPAE